MSSKKASLFKIVTAWAMLLFFTIPFASAEQIDIARQLTEPLTLPKGKTELGLGLDTVEKQDGSGWYIYPAAYVRHAFTDDLEFVPLGVRYRFWNDPQNNNQIAAKVRLAGMSDSRLDEAFYSVEAALEGKWHTVPELCVTYGLTDYHTIYTRGNSVEVTEARGGLLISMGKFLATEIYYGHDFIWGLKPTDLDSIGLTVHWNVSPEAEITLATVSNFLPPNDSFRTYGLANINQAYTFGVRWVF